MTCPICASETGAPHDDEQCVATLIKSGLFANAFNQTIPPPEKWTDQERQFANALVLQAIQWKKAELHT